MNDRNIAFKNMMDIIIIIAVVNVAADYNISLTRFK
jgi:hypothetical protein